MALSEDRHVLFVFSLFINYIQCTCTMLPNLTHNSVYDMLFCYYWIIILENCVAIYYFIIWDKTQSSGMVLFIALRSAFYLTQKKRNGLCQCSKYRKFYY